LSSTLVKITVGLIGISQPRARFAEMQDGLSGGFGEQGLVDTFVEFLH
jgi:hypothetical protein